LIVGAVSKARIRSGQLFVDWAMSKRGQACIKPPNLYWVGGTDAPQCRPGALGDLKLLYPADWTTRGEPRCLCQGMERMLGL